MTRSPNKLSRFWDELKRRRVIYAITVYASAAFVIIELINNLTEPLNLPSNLATIVVLVLAVGFPLAIILSWIYDLTSEGVEKTKPIEELAEGEKTVVPNAWKIATYVSFVVIIGLAVLNFMGRDKKLHAGDIQSLVILPFDNFTGDDGLEYFVSGLHSSLIGDIGRVSGLRVIGKTSSNTYKGVDMSAPDIASELDVDAVIEGTVMCLGDSICLQIRVLTTYPEERQLWIADYKEEKSQILNLYNKITKQIADEVKIELTPDELQFLATSKTVDKEAYDAYLRSYQYWDDLSLESLNKAVDYLNLAIEKDPEFAQSYLGLATVWAGLAQLGFVAPEVAGPKIFENMDKATELDPDLPGIHYANAVIAVWTEWDWEKGEKEFLKALSINPNHAMSRVHYAHLLMILKRYDEAYFHSQMAVELDPMNPLVLALSAMVDELDRIQLSLEKSKKALEIEPDHSFALNAYAEAAYFNGDYEGSIEAELKVWPALDEIARKEVMVVFQNEGYVAAVRSMITFIEEYGSSYHVGPFEMGYLYSLAGDLDKSIDYCIKGYEIRDPMMPYITLLVRIFDQIKYDPRIISIIEEMNLPFDAPD